MIRRRRDKNKQQRQSRRINTNNTYKQISDRASKALIKIIPPTTYLYVGWPCVMVTNSARCHGLVCRKVGGTW
jgi:hypothetical protein